MKLSIDSNYPLEKYYLEDLEDNLFKINLDAETNLPDGWYKLVVEYTGDKIEISDNMGLESMDKIGKVE